MMISIVTREADPQAKRDDKPIGLVKVAARAEKT
jgi:hypothetical protein